MKKIIFLFILISLIVGCEKYDQISDAYGNFESEEIVLSSEAMGVLQKVAISEGDRVTKGQLIAVIDTTDTYLKKKDLEAQVKLLNLKYQKAQADLLVMKTELDIVKNDAIKHQNLYNSSVVSLEVLENYQHKQEILEKQYASSQLNLSLIKQETSKLGINIEQVNNTLAKSYLKSPLTGTVLTKFVQIGELVSPGKPVIKLANLADIYLKAFVTQTQLSSLALNQSVTILIDDNTGMRELAGNISYISSKAEFTPKTIQTRDERANLVYAIKIKLEYEDAIKIGMPAEVLFKRK